MAIQRRQSTTAKAREHVGFDWHGKSFRSELPVDNQPTNFIRFLLRRIQLEYLTPAEVAKAIASERVELHHLFETQSLVGWLELDRFHLWPLAACGTSAMSTLASRGESSRPWLSDPNKWEHTCDEAERLRGDRPRYGYVRWRGKDHELEPGEEYRDAVRRVAGNVLEPLGAM